MKARGVPTIQYVSPQVWAWRQGRVRTIGQSVDLVLCVLPFEVDFYRVARRAGGVRRPSTRRPHPDDERPGRRAGRARTPGSAPVVAVLPGSRMGEVTRLAPPFAATIAWLASQRPGMAFVAPMANAAARAEFERCVARVRARRRGARGRRAVTGVHGGERCSAARIGNRDARGNAREAADGRRVPGGAAHELVAAAVRGLQGRAFRAAEPAGRAPAGAGTVPGRRPAGGARSRGARADRSPGPRRARRRLSRRFTSSCVAMPARAPPTRSSSCWRAGVRRHEPARNLAAGGLRLGGARADGGSGRGRPRAARRPRGRGGGDPRAVPAGRWPRGLEGAVAGAARSARDDDPRARASPGASAGRTPPRSTR